MAHVMEIEEAAGAGPTLEPVYMCWLVTLLDCQPFREMVVCRATMAEMIRSYPNGRPEPLM